MLDIYKHYEGVLKDTGLIATALDFNKMFSIKSLLIFLEQCKQLPSFISGDTILPPVTFLDLCWTESQRLSATPRL